MTLHSVAAAYEPRVAHFPSVSNFQKQFAGLDWLDWMTMVCEN